MDIELTKSVIAMHKHHRKLDLLEDWALSFVRDTPFGVDNTGVTLSFNHGSLGSPTYKIYGSSSFKDSTSEPLFGQTCRSRGGEEQNPPLGLTILEREDSGLYNLDIQTDPNAMADIFKADDGETTTLQFCVDVLLMNPDSDEAANFVEVELRYTINLDGFILLDKFSTQTSDPITKGFTTSLGISASICKIPTKQGDTVSVCINATQPLTSIDSVVVFQFEATDPTTGTSISQIAFQNGAPASLTEEASENDPSNFRFNTILNANFYPSQGGLAVAGAGTCTIKLGRSRNLRQKMSASVPDPEHEENVTVSLSFLIGDSGISVSDDTSDSFQLPAFESTKQHVSSGPSILSVIAVLSSLLAFFMSIFAVWIAMQNHRDSSSADKGPSNEERSTYR